MNSSVSLPAYNPPERHRKVSMMRSDTGKHTKNSPGKSNRKTKPETGNRKIVLNKYLDRVRQTVEKAHAEVTGQSFGRDPRHLRVRRIP